MKKIYSFAVIISVVLLFVFTNTWAQTTCTTLKAGNWTDPTVWSCGAVPSGPFSGTINITFPVTFSTDTTIQVRGLVSVQVTGSGGINFGNGAGASSKLILVNLNSSILLSGSSNTISGGTSQATINVGGRYCSGPFNGSNEIRGTRLITFTSPGCTNSQLPVTLLSFTATPEGDRVQLAWSTTSEQDADHFIVERSANLTEYVTVGKVTAKGTTNTRQYYGLTDVNPSLGNNYYRLKQIDHNGTAYSFKLVSAVVTTDDIIAVVYPNPSHPGRIHLRLWNADDATVRLLTLAGQFIDSQLEWISGEVNLIPLHPLPTGTYLVEVQTQGQKRVSKVIVR